MQIKLQATCNNCEKTFEKDGTVKDIDTVSFCPECPANTDARPCLSKWEEVYELEHEIETADLKFLIELGKKMNAQDNRATQFVMFQVRQQEKVYTPDGDYSTRKDEIDGPDLCGNCFELYKENKDIPEKCEDWDCRGSFVHYNLEDAPVSDIGLFFTAKVAQAHIDQNHYHYDRPFVYGVSCWRNYEMQNVLEILSKLGSDDNQALSHYK